MMESGSASSPKGVAAAPCGGGGGKGTEVEAVAAICPGRLSIDDESLGKGAGRGCTMPVGAAGIEGKLECGGASVEGKLGFRVSGGGGGTKGGVGAGSVVVARSGGAGINGRGCGRGGGATAADSEACSGGVAEGGGVRGGDGCRGGGGGTVIDRFDPWSRGGSGNALRMS